jgi:RNA polymerase sigma-70 factor, ECF subfamily
MSVGNTPAGSGEQPETPDSPAVDAQFQDIYAELKAMAHAQRRRWEGDYTLNTTALLHEAYLKLSRAGSVAARDRGHFLALAGRAMRQILVNYAEARRTQKRSPPEHLPTDDGNPVGEDVADAVIRLHEALQRLEQLDPRRAQVVEYRFFAGLPIPDTAEVLGVSPATVQRDWKFASAWLRREIGPLPEELSAMG